MSKLTKMTSAVAAAGVGLAMLATPIVAQAKEVHIKVQAVIGTQTTEVKMLRDFMDDVTALTGGEVTFEVLLAGAVVGVKETLDAVDAGLVDGGFAWTHYWSGKHPAAMLLARQPVPVSVSTTSRSSPGSSLAAARSCTTSSGTRWA